MSGPAQKVTDEEILQALVQWKGNIKFIAEAVFHIRRKNLYDRVERLQEKGLALPLKAYRHSAETVSFFVRDRDMTPTVRAMSRIAPGGGHNSGGHVIPASSTVQAAQLISDGPYRNAQRGPNVQPMQTTAEESPIAPIKTIQPRPRTLRITDENQARLRMLRRRLEVAFGVETDENLLLNQLLEEVTEKWGEEKEALAQPKKKASREK